MIMLSQLGNPSARGPQICFFLPFYCQVPKSFSPSTLELPLFDYRKSFVMRSYRISPVTPLECAVAKSRFYNFFRMRSYKKNQGGGGVAVRMARHPNDLFAFNSGPLENLTRHAASLNPAGAFGVYQFCGPRKPFPRRAAAPGRAGLFAGQAGHFAIRFFLDLCDLPARFRLARGPLRGQLGHRRRIFLVVRSHCRDRFCPHLCALAPAAAPARHGRIRCLSVLLPNPCPSFPRIAARLCQFRHHRRLLRRPRIRSVLWRNPDGSVWLASVFYRPRPCQFRVASAVASLDASRARLSRQRGSSCSQHFANPIRAVCMGNLRESVLPELLAIFLHHLAAFLPRPRAPVLHGSHGGYRRRLLFVLRRHCGHLRPPLGWVDWPRSLPNPCPQDVYRWWNGWRRHFRDCLCLDRPGLLHGCGHPDDFFPRHEFIERLGRHADAGRATSRGPLDRA